MLERDIPSQSHFNTEAEEALLNHIASYRRHCNSLHPRGPLLLLTPDNESGCMKSVMSFIVGSLVAHSQLLNVNSAAQIISDLITYIPPSIPPTLPKEVASPAEVVNRQEGSGVECALVMASVLLGAGFHALVVQGSVTSTLVAADTTASVCPYLARYDQEEEAPPEVAPSKYTVVPPPDLRSKYAIIMEERARRRKLAEEEEEAKRKRKKDGKEETTEEGSPRNISSHLHFWVLLLPPNREVDIPTFVEPTTGQVIPLDSTGTSSNSPYAHIHAVFNHTNYWACTMYGDPISAGMFDLSDGKTWLPLITPPQPTGEVRSPSQSLDDQTRPTQQDPSQAYSTRDGSSSSGKMSKVLERKTTKEGLKIPKTWAKPITITEKALDARFPGGWREERYYRVLARRYSPFYHPRGTTLALTLYSPAGRAKEVRETFQHRKDGLLTRVTNLLTGEVVESFIKTRKDTLKRHRYWRAASGLASRADLDGIDNPALTAPLTISGNNQDVSAKEEVFKFHSKFRVDALRCRVICGPKWREEFDERPDLLLTRTVTFNSAESGPPRIIQCIEEEFGCPDDVDPHLAVQRRVFQLAESRILLVYHYGRHRLLQPTRSFVKPADGKPSGLLPDMTHGFQPDPSVDEPAMQQLWQILQEEMEAEARVQGEVREAVDETGQLRASRESEEQNIVLVPDMFNIIRNTTVQYILQQENAEAAEVQRLHRQYSEAHREETLKKKKDEREGRVDTIAPYLPLVPGEVDVAGSEMVKERCLTDLRERLALRANLLQDRLDQARASVLECREELSRRKRLTPDERSALTIRTTAAEAAHRRLRAQLAAWKHDAAERYEALSAQLETDLRLNTANTTIPSGSSTVNGVE